MKLTNLSLAILVAVGVAACGGSGDDNSNKPNDPQKPNTPQNNDNKKPTPPANDNNIVDPTGTKVVDDKDLTKQSTVGTLQYIRRDGSRYDRTLNPSKPASASPLLGTTLNDQNPSLTNIVLARQEVTRADGTPVKAQFTGSSNPIPLDAEGKPNLDSVTNKNSLQQENFSNVDVLAGLYATGASNINGKHADDATSTNVANNVDDKGKNTRRAVATAGFEYAQVDKTTGKRKDATAIGTVTADTPASGDKYQNISAKTSATNNITAVIELAEYKSLADGLTHKGKDVDGKDLYFYSMGKAAVGANKPTKTVTPTFAISDKGGVRYGKDLVWWTSPETAFENYVSRDKKDGTNDMELKQAADLANNGSVAATNGLVRVGGGLSTLGQELNYKKETGKWEDHHNTKTRIFGRYHLAYTGTNSKNKGVHPVDLNSFSGAKSFVAEYETNAAGTEVGKATQYSLGASPTTLKHVQYGRVTTNLDLDEGQAGYPDGFIRNEFTKKNDESGVDNYFYRGTDATTIEQMAALPSNATATYNGHALMYGIDNDYHGGGKRNLPNAFAGATSGQGLGNFVEARVNFGTKRVLGEVYNEWLLDPTKPGTTRDKLVKFQGNITGNTVVGTATRTYVNSDDNATFKASFFGEKAEEMGGSFNSVKDADKYGDAYGANDWGGVFGASKGGSSNTFQGDDGGNVYGQNNYDQ